MAFFMTQGVQGIGGNFLSWSVAILVRCTLMGWGRDTAM